MKVWIFFAAVLLATTNTFGAGPIDVVGLWKTEGGNSVLEIFRCGEKICGKIVWLKEPNYIDSKDGPVGETKVDRKNPDPALRTRPILGLRVIEGLTANGDNHWDSGTRYDPEAGKNYSCKMRLAAPDQLKLRGYIWLPLFGRNFGLTRQQNIPE